MPAVVGDNPEKPRNEAVISILGGIIGDDGTVTSDPFTWWEHNPKINGTYKNWHTCTRALGGCPFCDADPQGEQMRRYFCGGWTVIDHSEWTSKTGILVKNQKKLLVAKSDMVAVFRKKQELRGTLVGTKWHVFRSGAKKANIGDQWEFIENIDLDSSGLVDGENNPVDSGVIDYMKVLTPPTAEATQSILNQWRPSTVGGPPSGEPAGTSGGHGQSVPYDSF
jgi:hypothetical protein